MYCVTQCFSTFVMSSKFIFINFVTYITETCKSITFRHHVEYILPLLKTKLQSKVSHKYINTLILPLKVPVFTVLYSSFPHALSYSTSSAVLTL